MFWLDAKQWGVALVISALAVFAPIKSVLIAVFVMVIADFALGVVTAIKRKELLTSFGFRRSVYKVLAYEVVICAGYICQTFLTGTEVPLASILGGMIGVAELTSIAEHVTDLTGLTLASMIQQHLSQRIKGVFRDRNLDDRGDSEVEEGADGATPSTTTTSIE